MTTLLYEYYISDFSKYIGFNVKDWSIMERGVTTKIVANVHVSLDSKSTFLSYYLPKFEDHIRVITSLINLAQENIDKLFYKNTQIQSIDNIPLSNFRFQKKIVFYYEGFMNKIGFAELQKQLLHNAVILEYFDLTYLQDKNKTPIPKIPALKPGNYTLEKEVSQVISETMSEFKLLDTEKFSIEELKERLKPIFTGYTVFVPTVEINTILFRGIEYNQKPVLGSFLGITPKKFAKKNRASREEFPMFYCSTNKFVTLFELKAKINCKLIISKWSTQKEFAVNHAGFASKTLKGLGSTREVPPFAIRSSDDLNIEIDSFLAHFFSLDIEDNRYNLSIAIAESLLNHDIFKGLSYPTIPMRANGDNFVLKEEFINDNGLKFEGVEYIEVLDYNSDTMSYKIKTIDSAETISAEGIIEWKNLGETFLWGNNIKELILKSEGGKWNYYNKDGTKLQ